MTFKKFILTADGRGLAAVFDTHEGEWESIAIKTLPETGGAVVGGLLTTLGETISAKAREDDLKPRAITVPPPDLSFSKE